MTSKDCDVKTSESKVFGAKTSGRRVDVTLSTINFDSSGSFEGVSLGAKPLDAEEIIKEGAHALESQPKKPKFFGRRSGRKLRGHHVDLLETLLPSLSLRVRDSSDGVFAVDKKDAFWSSYKRYFLEIGFGGGEHLAAWAEKNPHDGFVGCEPYRNGVASLLRHLEKEKTRNVRVFDDDVRLILDSFGEGSLDGIFVMFPDPWPKARHHERRFLRIENFNRMARLLKPGAPLYIGSDHHDYIRDILYHGLQCSLLSWDVKDQTSWLIPPFPQMRTRYAQKAERLGGRGYYFTFLKKG